MSPNDIKRVALPVLRHRVLAELRRGGGGSERRANHRRPARPHRASAQRHPRLTWRSPRYGALLDAVRGVHWPARRAVTEPDCRHAPVASSAARRPSSPNTDCTARATIRGGSTGGCSGAAIAPTSGSPPIARILPTTIVLDASASMAFPLATRAKWTARAGDRRSASPPSSHADGDPVGVAVHDGRGGSTRPAAAHASRRGRRDRARRSMPSIPTALDPLAPAIAGIRSAAHRDHHRSPRRRRRAAARCARAHRGRRRSASRSHRRARRARPAAARDAGGRSRRAGAPALARRNRRVAGTDAPSPSWRAEMARRWRAAGASYVEVITDEAASHAVRRIVEPPAAAADAPMTWLLPSALGIAGVAAVARRRAALHRAEPSARRAAADGALRSARGRCSARPSRRMERSAAAAASHARRRGDRRGGRRAGGLIARWCPRESFSSIARAPSPARPSCATVCGARTRRRSRDPVRQRRARCAPIGQRAIRSSTTDARGSLSAALAAAMRAAVVAAGTGRLGRARPRIAACPGGVRRGDESACVTRGRAACAS